jgi:hypothetical protein
VNFTVASPSNLLTGLSLGDVNGDGKLDLVVASTYESAVKVLLNTGNSAIFGTLTPYTVGADPASTAIGDLNGDGKPDLAVAVNGGASVAFLLNSGSGTFGSASSCPIAGAPAWVSLGDFNKDGKLDVAVAATSTTGGLSVLLSTP